MITLCNRGARSHDRAHVAQEVHERSVVPHERSTDRPRSTVALTGEQASPNPNEGRLHVRHGKKWLDFSSPLESQDL
ncbi:hypothetical protein AB1Y20_012588 [Prymnesium parvum]|uniref:Uncharacterized protein n=1 Tax=Prymnesium parvum TaxID=97485 RepID=A0AB34IIX1_PRYPA